jgi:hypothetical protein
MNRGSHRAATMERVKMMAFDSSACVWKVSLDSSVKWVSRLNKHYLFIRGILFYKQPSSLFIERVKLTPDIH